MSHVGDPWVDETVAMLVKHPNVFLMTAGFAPKYLPPALVKLMDSRGSNKVMWSSYYPIMTVERALTEAQQLPLRPEAMAKYLGENAARVFGVPEASPPDARLPDVGTASAPGRPRGRSRRHTATTD